MLCQEAECQGPGSCDLGRDTSPLLSLVFVIFKIQITACKGCSPNPGRIHGSHICLRQGCDPSLHTLFSSPGRLFLPFHTKITFYDPFRLNLNFSSRTTLKNCLPPVSLFHHSPVTLIVLNTLYLSIYCFCLLELNFYSMRARLCLLITVVTPTLCVPCTNIC